MGADRGSGLDGQQRSMTLAPALLDEIEEHHFEWWQDLNLLQSGREILTIPTSEDHFYKESYRMIEDNAIEI